MLHYPSLFDFLYKISASIRHTTIPIIKGIAYKDATQAGALVIVLWKLGLLYLSEQ